MWRWLILIVMFTCLSKSIILLVGFVLISFDLKKKKKMHCLNCNTNLNVHVNVLGENTSSFPIDIHGCLTLVLSAVLCLAAGFHQCINHSYIYNVRFSSFSVYST